MGHKVAAAAMLKRSRRDAATSVCQSSNPAPLATRELYTRIEIRNGECVHRSSGVCIEVCVSVYIMYA